MFCPKCGSKDVVDVFCANCLREQRPLVESFKPFEVEVCTSCRRVRHRGRWHDSEKAGEAPRRDGSESGRTSELLAELLKEHLVFPNYAIIENVEVEPIDIPFKSGLKVTGEAQVLVTGKPSSKAKAYSEEYSFPYTVQNTLCSRCSKIGTQYFEGVLQVRNEDKETKRFVIDFVNRAGAQVSKTAPSGKGTDYYISSRVMVERAALALQERFGGAIKTSAQLFSHNRQTSKDIFRVNSFVELPPFREGDAVSADGSVLFVLERGKRIKFYNPRRNKIEFHEYKEHDWKKLPIFETTIASTQPSLMVIHPETFQSVKAWNLVPREHEPGEKVHAALEGERLYIVEQSERAE